MYQAALDPAANHVALAVLQDRKVLHAVSVPMRGRDGAQMLDFVQRELAKLNLKLDDVTRWSIGSGPGSFTGLRLAAALAAGWSFQRPEVLCRSVPSSFALATAARPQEGEHLYCLYDGRNHELICCEVAFGGGEFSEVASGVVLDQAAAAKHFAGVRGRLVGLADEEAALRPLLPEGVNAVFVSASCPEALALQSAPAFDNDLTRLNYIRPAVYAQKQ